MNTHSNPRESRQAPTRAKFVAAVGITGAGLFLAVVLLTGKPAPEIAAPPEPPSPVVSVVVADPRPESLPVYTQGSVKARRSIRLTAEVAGKVDRTASNFMEGDFFARGDTLLQIEQADYEFAIARARSQVAAAEQRVAEERGRNRQAQREWRELGTDEANALFLREPQLKAAEAALEAAKADLAAAELALSRTKIKAPFDGRIAERKVELGQYVSPGTEVAQIYATDVVDVALPLNDSQIAALNLPLYAGDALAQPVTLSARFGGADWQWSATIRRVDAVVDRQSRVINVIAEVRQPFQPHPMGRPPLTPGMFVKAEIPTPPRSAIVKLPAAALRSDDSVLVVNDQQRLERQVVNVIRRSEQWAWVGGLDKGVVVIREQSGLLVAGLKVEVAATAVAQGSAI
ncbi:MAG: efflux RND transporter periplasmic adaptor subunit [Cellvibrionales bacterium]